ncbi:MAG: hypothetical protein KJ808_07825 [Acidobacteria bacterium]|nr:hypothetical protein [Acidobacteriota bacterium]MBU4306966.1 hypothetical protein [Acidobacteriota bacterium]MCG2812171.1 hypothetical protein [Candidatus Aminicenantes bacterium]
MENRILTLLLIWMLCLPVRAELLKLSLLQKPAARFTLKFDIFNGSSEAERGQTTQGQMPAAQADALQKTIAEEISQSITYEGFIVKNSKRSALLNVSGEFFMVNEHDQVLDKIKILKISKDMVTIEYDNQPYDIRIKGDQNG